MRYSQLSPSENVAGYEQWVLEASEGFNIIVKLVPTIGTIQYLILDRMESDVPSCVMVPPTPPKRKTQVFVISNAAEMSCAGVALPLVSGHEGNIQNKQRPSPIKLVSHADASPPSPPLCIPLSHLQGNGKLDPSLDLLPPRGPTVTLSNEEWSTAKVLIASTQLRSGIPLPHLGSQDTLNWLVFRTVSATTGRVMLSLLLAGARSDAPGGRLEGPAAND